MRMCHVTVLPHSKPRAQAQPMGQPLLAPLQQPHLPPAQPRSPGECRGANTNQAPLNSPLGCWGSQPPDQTGHGEPRLSQVGVPVCPPRGLGSNPDCFSSFPLPGGISPAEEMAQLTHSTAHTEQQPGSAGGKPAQPSQAQQPGLTLQTPDPDASKVLFLKRPEVTQHHKTWSLFCSF